jgi:glucose/arabinose dehydrogenase
MDNLAEGLAPDEINILASGGQFGHPYFYSQNFQNPKYRDVTGVQVPKSPKGPVIELQPFSGSSDAEFYTGNSLGPDARNSFIVVFNGYESGAVIRPSELRTGGKVVLIRSDRDGSNARQADLFSGWLTPKGVYWGRPVGIAVTQDGTTFFVTDEKNGVLYRFTSN